MMDPVICAHRASAQHENGDDEFGRVAESDVQEPANRSTRHVGYLLGGFADVL